jgi:ketosteroid isomerase-like protein
MTTFTDNGANGQAIVAAMQAGDIDGLLARCHPDLEVYEADSLPYPGVYRGREGFRELLGKILALSELSIDEATIRDAGDDVVFIYMEVTLTSRASGRSLHTQILEMETFQDGLVRRMDVFYKDTKQVVELLSGTS